MVGPACAGAEAAETAIDSAVLYAEGVQVQDQALIPMFPGGVLYINRLVFPFRGFPCIMRL